MEHDTVKNALAPCPKCGGEAAYRGHYSLRSFGAMWVASVWCRECYVCIERMVSKRELELSNGSNSELLKDITKKKAIEAWNAWAKEEANADKR